MIDRDPMSQPPLDHGAVDELAAALSLGALDADEARALIAHLSTCPLPHAELRELLGANSALAASVEGIAPSPGLRDRLMATVAATAQEAPRVTGVPTREAPPAPSAPSSSFAEPWWKSLLDPRSAGFARGLAAVAVAGVIVLGAVTISLRSSLDARQSALDRVASALAGGGPAFAVTAQTAGAGSGYVIDHAGQPLLVAAVPPAPAGRLYEMWLLDAQGQPVSAGTFTITSGQIAVVRLDVGLTGYTTFAITVEERRVDAPTTKPIIAGAIGALGRRAARARPRASAMPIPLNTTAIPTPNASARSSPYAAWPPATAASSRTSAEVDGTRPPAIPRLMTPAIAGPRSAAGGCAWECGCGCGCRCGWSCSPAAADAVRQRRRQPRSSHAPMVSTIAPETVPRTG